MRTRRSRDNPYVFPRFKYYCKNLLDKPALLIIKPINFGFERGFSLSQNKGFFHTQTLFSLESENI